MEELLGALNEKALDKSLKDNFTTDFKSENPINHKVLISKVILEIQNGENFASVIRYIKSDNKENNSKVAFIYDTKIELLDEENKQKYFIRGGGNNEDGNGFYSWLANFIGVELPTVSNTSRTSNYSPLYLQIIFSSFFIEQTKGWSDFFATMPNFSIPRTKEKLVEFLRKRLVNYSSFYALFHRNRNFFLLVPKMWQ